MPEKCDAKALFYAIVRHPVYNIYDIYIYIYVRYICISVIYYTLIVYNAYIYDI